MTIFSRLTIRNVWIESFRLYRKVFPHVWFLSAAIGCFMSIPFILNTLYPIKRYNLINNGAMNVTAIACVVISLIVLLIKIYLASMILYKTSIISEGMDVTLKNAADFVEKRYFRIILGMFLVYVSYLLGIVFLVFPMVILTIFFTMVHPLILLDNKPSFRALKDSSKLVWCNWWRTLCAFLVLILTGILTVLFLCLVVYIAKIFHINSFWYNSLGSVLVIIFANILANPLYYSILFVQFKNLKSRQTLLI